ncbi:glycosyltransferase [Natronococcus roseus]|uniref:glycosyltransferase n=1 Tax=Natronococcus roseus TaxID=1052014 RepID=UPI00374D8FEE
MNNMDDLKANSSSSDDMIDLCFISGKIYKYLQPGQGAAGGAQRQQYLLGKELANQGHEISFIVGDYGQPSHERIGEFDIWKGCPNEIKSPKRIPYQVVDLFWAMKKANAEFYYVRGAPLLCAPAYLFSKILGKKFIFCIANDKDVSPETVEDLPIGVKHLYLRALSNSDIIITQTKKQQKMVKTLFQRKTTVIPNGYSTVSTNKITDHCRRNTVLWVGTDDRHQKHPERFLQLAKSLPNIHFTMICRQTTNLEFHKKIKKQAEYIENLKFIDFVDPDEIHEYYNRSYALINTSDYEGFPNTFLEAWRYETPIVSLYFDLDGVLSSRSVGFLADSMSNLAKYTSELASNETKRRYMGKKGREFMETNYSLNSIGHMYEEVITSR